MSVSRQFRDVENLVERGSRRNRAGVTIALIPVLLKRCFDALQVDVINNSAPVRVSSGTSASASMRGSAISSRSQTWRSRLLLFIRHSATSNSFRWRREI